MKPTIGQRIKELREENGWNQDHLIKLVGLKSKSTISNYETDYSVPPGKIIERLAQAFDVTVDYLMGDTDLKECYVQFMKGRHMPVFKTTDSNAITNKQYSKIESYMELPDCVNLRRGDFFAIIIDDNGIDKYHINKNDIVVVARQQVIDSGNLCAVMVKNKLMVREVYTEGDIITLVPKSYDEDYNGIKYKKEDVKVLGVVIKAVINISEAEM